MKATLPQDGNCDMSIHSNPDSRAWAEFFVKTITDLATQKMMATVGSNKEEQAGSFAIDIDYMHGWFANAMMAMHDHLAPRLIKSIDPDFKDAREAAPQGKGGSLKVGSACPYCPQSRMVSHLIATTEGFGFAPYCPSCGSSGSIYAKGVYCSETGGYAEAPKESESHPLYTRQENGTNDNYYHAGGLDPWTLERAMQSTGIAFVDARRADIIEYAFRLKGMEGNRKEALLKLREDLTKARDNCTAAVGEIDRTIALFEKDEEDQLTYKQWVSEGLSESVMRFDDLTEKSIANLMRPSPLYEMVEEERIRRGEWRGAKRAGMETVGDF